MKVLKIPVLFICFSYLFNACLSIPRERDYYPVQHVKIEIDGDISDWVTIRQGIVKDNDHLWIGPGLSAEFWEGEKDLSFSWRTAWDGQKLFFLFEVKDNIISDFNQEFTWMNDCIEIHLDPGNRGGQRIEGIDEHSPLEDRLGRKKFGYEMHFMPDQLPKVYLDDTRGVFYTDSIQNDFFENTWEGKAVTRYTDQGYLMEIGFRIPDADMGDGKIIGLDFAVCDDDGNGRENLMVFSGYKGPFWITMDNFKKFSLK